MSRQIILCADDFAGSEAITQGILEVAAQGRLSAVSCMTEAPRWPDDAQLLKPYAGAIDIGVHFCLTEPFGQVAWSLPRLIRSSVLGTLDAEAIRLSLTRQLERFESAMQRTPDFVDGHQHVHAFPVIRDLVHQTLAARYPCKRPYLRRVSPRIWNHDAPLKAVVLRFLAREAAEEAVAAGFQVPAAFGGLYSLSRNADFPHYMRNWLASAMEGTLLMCHPGAPDAADPIGPARSAERSYLLGARFDDDLTTTGVRLARFAEIFDVA